MCHDDDSRPPSPPRVGPVADSGPLTLTAADGTVVRAYRAVPGAPVGRNVVILPDVRGLHPYYEALAVRFAEAGFHALAFDYFGRTAADQPRDDSFEYRPHVEALTPEQVASDASAATAALLAEHDAPTYSLGFCFGGSMSWRLAASDLDLAGCMGFYGMPKRVADVEGDLHRPMLLLVAGADAATPVEEFRDFDARLHDADVPHEMHVYDGAPHSFFDRGYAQWQDACADAWRRILSFTGAPAA
jgi:carboxymethylenebutenolidase